MSEMGIIDGGTYMYLDRKLVIGDMVEVLSPFKKCSSCAHWISLSVTFKDAYCKLGYAETCIANNRASWKPILRPVYPDFIKKEEMMI